MFLLLALQEISHKTKSGFKCDLLCSSLENDAKPSIKSHDCESTRGHCFMLFSGAVAEVTADVR
jgi:hypothetical protein